MFSSKMQSSYFTVVKLLEACVAFDLHYNLFHCIHAKFCMRAVLSKEAAVSWRRTAGPGYSFSVMLHKNIGENKDPTYMKNSDFVHMECMPPLSGCHAIKEENCISVLQSNCLLFLIDN